MTQNYFLPINFLFLICLKSLATDVFYEHELFRTISDNCFSVTFISDSENHKLHDFRESREL